MAEEKNLQNNEQENTPQDRESDAHASQFDTGEQALAGALRWSFFVLKILVVILIVIFFLSGFQRVGSDENALVLRFGKIRGIGEDRLRGPGLHWAWPYPVDEMIRIPVGKKPSVAIDAFWYYETPQEQLPEGVDRDPRVPPKLNPIRDGYTLTRSEPQEDVEGFDYSIVHTKWQLNYRIDNPEKFFRNMLIPQVQPGESYYEVTTESLKPVLRSIVEDAVVTAMVNYTIDQARTSQDVIPGHVEELVQEKLDTVESGLVVVSMQLTDVTWPRQVDQAFLNYIRASQRSNQLVTEARSYAETTLNQTAGPVAEELFEAITDDSTTQQQEPLWERLAGSAQQIIAQARSYRTEVVESARANADYLNNILPEYRKRPELVVQQIYQDTVERVLAQAEEKMVIHPTPGGPASEIRVLLNRDPSIKKQQDQQDEQ